MSDTIHELKPCPFCGGSGEIRPSCIGGFTYEAYVSCVECGCKSPSSHYEHKAFMPEHIAKAVENWNTRPELAEARAEVERLEKAVKVVQSAFSNYKNADAEIAKIEMREAKIEMREAKILAASCNSDSVNSERAANAILTDEIERKDKLIEQMRELLQSSVEDWAHKFNHDENPAHGGWAVRAGKILNELQALSAAEWGE